MNIIFGWRGVQPLVVTGLGLALVVLSLTSTGPPDVLAVEPGVNCSSYEGGVCVVEVGDIWFCDATFSKGLQCPTSIVAGDTVRWEYNSSLFIHTTTECDGECDDLPPPSAPLWDSGLLFPGDSFEFTFTTPGEYLYYCALHPSTQRGLIRVLEPISTPTVTPTATATPTPTNTSTPTDTPTPTTQGDVNCDALVNVVDALFILQFQVGLRVDTGGCPLPPDALYVASGDVNKDGLTKVVDALFILQCEVGVKPGANMGFCTP